MTHFSSSMSELFSNIQNPQQQFPFLEINELFEDVPTSIITVNRAVAFYVSGQLKQATQNLEHCLQDNHLNFIAYFNLFSMLMDINKYQALNNLCCALSCLYLLRAQRQGKQENEQDIKKALKYCQNNIEAHLLKTIQYIEKQKFTLALNQINWALEMQPKSSKLIIVKQAITDKMQKKQERYITDKTQLQVEEGHLPSRLVCGLYNQEEGEIKVEEEIKEKLSEFNEIFSELNHENVSIVRRSPLVYMLGKKSVTQKQQLSKSNNNFNKYSTSSFMEEGEEKQRKTHKIQQNSESLDLHTCNVANFIPEESLSETLHVLEDGKKLFIKALAIQIEGFKNCDSNLFYCQFDYGGQDNKFIVENQLEQEHQILSLKVFRKELHKFHDTLLGEAKQQIINIGILKLPIKHQTSEIGFVTVEIKLKQ